MDWPPSLTQVHSSGDSTTLGRSASEIDKERVRVSQLVVPFPRPALSRFMICILPCSRPCAVCPTQLVTCRSEIQTPFWTLIAPVSSYEIVVHLTFCQITPESPSRSDLTLPYPRIPLPVQNNFCTTYHRYQHQFGRSVSRKYYPDLSS